MAHCAAHARDLRMTKALTSKDYDTDPKSFTLDTADSYFIRETVAYVKGTPAARADAVTVIVWFHGFYVDKRGDLFRDTPGEEVKLLESLKNCPIDELIFIAPFMGFVQPKKEFILDKNNEKIPVVRKGKIVPGEFQKQFIGSPAYRAAEAQLGKAADSYLAKVLEGLANFLIGKGQTLSGSGGKAVSAFTIKNLILACHSGGGVAMQAFVEGLSTNKAALKGCWCFDCLYGDKAPGFWFNRGANAAPFYAYYQDTAANAKALLKLMGHERDTEFSESGNLNVIDNSKKTHYRTASEGFPERLKAIKL
jgi:hypothetical protein